MEVVAELESGREAHGQRAWRKAHEALTAADRSARLGPSDLEMLATSAYMLGLEEEYRQALLRESTLRVGEVERDRWSWMPALVHPLAIGEAEA